jgi:SAM-dependent methyltransferase
MNHGKLHQKGGAETSPKRNANERTPSQVAIQPRASTAELGDDVLEIGPGPGLATDLLRTRVARVTAIEVDAGLAEALASRLSETNVDVIQGDATDSGLPDSRFSAATCFSVLHHIPSAEIQDQLFTEITRVLRPGGAFIGEDPTDSDFARQFHAGDTFVPLDSKELRFRLEGAGLGDVTMQVGANRVRFIAFKP